MGAVGDRLDDLSAAASAAAEDLKDAAEDAKRRGLQALVDLGLKAQEALDSMPAEDADAEDEGPPEATQLPAQ
jgi:hypothetical protein